MTYNEEKVLQKIVKALGKQSMTPAQISKKIGMHNMTIGKYIKKAKRQGLITVETVNMGTRKIRICRVKKR